MVIKKILKLFTNGVFLIAFFSIISRIMGLLRDRLLAANFGAGDALDAYYAAFRLPDLVFNTLIFGALGSAFIPQFVKLWLDDKEKAFDLANKLLNILTIIVIIITIIFWLLSPLLIPILTPGFDGIKQSTTLDLTRIMLISIVFFSLSTIMAGILNSLKKFFFYSLAPIFYNLGIIIGILYLAPFLGIKGVAYGVILGSFLHFLIQLIAAHKEKWQYRFSLKFDPVVKKVLKLMLPRTIGLAAVQINQIIITAIASFLKSGSLAIFNLANNIQFFPINIFGISLSTVVFPSLSQFWAKNDLDNFRDRLYRSFRQIIYFVIPVSLFLIFFKNEIVGLLLGVGKFSQANINETGLVLAYFSLSIFAQSLLPVLTKAFYAQENTKLPVTISMLSIILNVILAMILYRTMAVSGLALSFSISTIFNFYLLYFAMKRKIKIKTDDNFLKFCFKVIIISLISIIFGYLSMGLLGNFYLISNLISLLIKLMLVSIVCLILYYILSKIYKIKEIYLIKKYLFLK
jgi:putative peptidoglycan lipid II flippase